MKLDPGIHIAMHSVLSLKPGVTTCKSGAKRYIEYTQYFQSLIIQGWPPLVLNLPLDECIGNTQHNFIIWKRLKEEEWKQSSFKRSKSQVKRQAQDLSKWGVSVPKDKVKCSTQLRQNTWSLKKRQKGLTLLMCKLKVRSKSRLLKKR